ncbi:uncharacterized protein LOC114755080 isoform X2 [Neltuma alba]|uniref:uncharacterized protein LOC114755080 isoform X2 n=1 Tax=Neltuma alba TaxID=207710 RepID=UPI0010A51833|nr:uncharacterized protein LOC114755080 isoform X2 [Prosopis alba]
MGSVDRVGDRTFKPNFTVDGALKLREKVNEKLKEFMGDYTDDTLVDYVIVLLRNGRQKEQAKNELNVFLGDDSDSFVSWLWDHLTLNIDLYVQPKEGQDGAPKKIISEVQASVDDAQHLNSESDRGKSHKLSRRRHNKDWKGLGREETEPPTLRSSVVDNSHSDEKTRTEADHHPKSPPSPLVRRKRGHPDEQKTKRDAISQATINAPRRLLQFAVRDAVATSRPSNSGPSVEPSLKRLRSVVSTSSADSSLAERPQRLQPIPRVSNPMSTVIKAVAEAAEDVMKFKSSGSVFDRLGRGTDPSDGSCQLEDDYQIQEQNQAIYLQRTDYSGQYATSNTMLEDEADFPFDHTSDNEEYNDVNAMGHRGVGALQLASSGGNTGDNSSMVQYGVAKNTDHNMYLKQNRGHEQPAAPNTSHEIVNISVNVNTWKSPQYQEPREVAEIDGLKTRDSEAGTPRSCHQLMKAKASTLKANTAFNVQKESQKTHVSASGSGAAGRPLEDADSRTIFVGNVHFAATKDSLSRHFNKFGDVLKVVILVDAATGQPKGSAYVEFMRKESAENALSLDGTSFMSRILKVVKKGAAPQESTPTIAWPRGVRGSSFPTARFSRAPFPRGSPGAFWSRPPMRIGARSMQWKRDAQGPNQPDNGASFNTSSTAVPAALRVVLPM